MQNGTMPQFGVRSSGGADNNASSGVSFQGMGSGGVFPPRMSQEQQQSQPGNTPAQKVKKPNLLTKLNKEQALTALVAVFGFLALIFLVSTVALAVSNNGNGNAKKQSATALADGTVLKGLGFSTKTIENKVEGAVYKYGEMIENAEGQLVLAVTQMDSGSGANFVVNWEFVPGYYSVSSTRNDRETFLLLADGMIADILVGRASKDVNDDVLVMLLTDGRVAYMPIKDSLEKYSFKIAGTIEGVEDAVKLYTVYENLGGDENDLTPTVMVQKTDGTIIDLRNELLKAVGKDVR